MAPCHHRPAAPSPSWSGGALNSPAPQHLHFPSAVATSLLRKASAEERRRDIVAIFVQQQRTSPHRSAPLTLAPIGAARSSESRASSSRPAELRLGSTPSPTPDRREDSRSPGAPVYQDLAAPTAPIPGRRPRPRAAPRTARRERAQRATEQVGALPSSAISSCSTGRAGIEE